MFITTNKLYEAWMPPEEFKLVTIYGPLGYGKSAFAFKVAVELLMKVYRIDRSEAWKMLRQFIVFHPQQFFNKLDDIQDLALKRIPFIVWDDAGIWLYALDWNDPFLIALGKYLSVARTHLASIIMTTPSPEYIFKKVRQFPQALNISITKAAGYDLEHIWRRRAVPYIQYYNIVKGYRVTRLKYQRKAVEEIFSCKIPGDEHDAESFYGWYKPLRDGYEDLALDLLRRQIQKLRKEMPLLENYPNLKVPTLTL